MTQKTQDTDGAAEASGQDHPALPEVNEATLVGRLSNTPRVKSFGEGKERAQFTLAVPRPSRKENNKPFHDYITVVGWGAIAKQCEGLSKGDGLQVGGRIKTWQDKDNKRLHWEITADLLQVLDRATPRQGELAGV